MALVDRTTNMQNLIMVYLICAIVFSEICGANVVSSERIDHRTSSRTAKKTILKIVAYTYGLTVAEIYRSPVDRSLQYCKLTEIGEGELCEKKLQELNRPVRNICRKKMMALINECMELKNEEVLSDEKNLGDDTGYIEGFWNGIFPGTKWCGIGHIAKNYFDLGAKYELDKCCRAHDHCPIKVPPLSFFPGIFSWKLYTTSHCDCDIDFYNCLLAANSSAADAVGDMYFNVFKINCVREAPGTNICPTLGQNKDRCHTGFPMDKPKLLKYTPEVIFPTKKPATSSKPPR